MFFDLRPALSQPLMFLNELQSDSKKKAQIANESTSGGVSTLSSFSPEGAAQPRSTSFQEQYQLKSPSGCGGQSQIAFHPPSTQPPSQGSPNRRIEMFRGATTDESSGQQQHSMEAGTHFHNDGDAFGEEEDVQWVFVYTPEMNLKAWLIEMNMQELASNLKAAVPMAYDGNEFLFIGPKDEALAAQSDVTPTALATVLPSRQKTVFGLGYELGVHQADSILEALDKKFDFPDYDRSLVLCRGLLADEEQAAAATVLDALGERSSNWGSSGRTSNASSNTASPSASKVWADHPLLLASGGSLKLNSQVEEYYKAWIYIAKPNRTPQSKGGNSAASTTARSSNSSGSMRLASPSNPEGGEFTAVSLLAQGVHLPDVTYFDRLLTLLRPWAPIWYYRRVEKFMKCAQEQHKRSDAFGRSAVQESSDNSNAINSDPPVATVRRTRSASQHSFGTELDLPQTAVPAIAMMLPTLSFTDHSHSPVNAFPSALFSTDVFGRSGVAGGRSTLGLSVASTTVLWYFAYGSNLSLAQLILRVGEPLERLPVRLEGYRLVVNKASGANPRICYANIEASASTPTAPGVSRESLEEVYGFTTCLYGVAYRLTGAQLRQMDSFEGGYDRRLVTCEVISSPSPQLSSGSGTSIGEKIEAVAYIATGRTTSKEGRPSKEYMQKILDGRAWLPPSYTTFLESIPTSGEDSPRHNLRQAGLL